MYTELFSKGLRRNQRIVHAQAEGLSHADSLAQTEFNVNCFNWVLGHIVASRGEILKVLDGDPVLSDDQAERYRRESDPIKGEGPGVLPFSELLDHLDESELRLEAALTDADEAFMAEEIPAGEDRTASRAAQVMFLFFHDTHHTGQTDVIRQLSGKSDKII